MKKKKERRTERNKKSKKKIISFDVCIVKNVENRRKKR